MSLRFISIFALFIFHACVISAYSAEPMILEEILVEGEKVPPSKDTLSVREVRESPARDMGEALAVLPGVEMVRKGTIANDVVLRGMQRDNINVLLDGTRVQGGCPSRMDPPAFHFDFAEIESIEITKGPYDLRHSGSLGGSVNAVGKTPPPGSSVNTVLTYGSFDLLHASLSGSHATDSYFATLGYAFKYSLPTESGDGRRITDIYPETSKNRYRDDNLDSRAYDIHTVWAKGETEISGNARTRLDIAYQDAGHVLYPALLMDAEYDRTVRLNSLTTIDRAFGLEDLELQVYWTGVDHLMHDEFRESSRPSMAVTRDYMMQTDADTSTFGVRIGGEREIGNGMLSIGIDNLFRNWDAVNRSAMYQTYAAQPMIPDVDLNQAGIYAEYARSITRNSSLKGGARLDYADIAANRINRDRLTTLYEPYHGDGLESSADFLRPSGFLQWSWTPLDRLEVLAGLASASRMPDPQEMFIGLDRRPTMMAPTTIAWVGNPELVPVRNNQADLGLKYSDRNVVANAALFYSRIDHYIELANIADPDGSELGTLPAARSYRNIDALLYGGELSGQISLPSNFYLGGGLAVTRAENRATDKSLAEIPPLTGTVALRYDSGSWFVELSEKMAARQDRVDDALNEVETPGWAVTDIKAGATFDPWSLVAGVNNLFDRYYFSHLSYQRDPFRSGVRVPETGLLAFVTLTYRFK